MQYEYTNIASHISLWIDYKTNIVHVSWFVSQRLRAEQRNTARNEPMIPRINSVVTVLPYDFRWVPDAHSELMSRSLCDIIMSFSRETIMNRTYTECHTVSGQQFHLHWSSKPHSSVSLWLKHNWSNTNITQTNDGCWRFLLCDALNGEDWLFALFINGQ